MPLPICNISSSLTNKLFLIFFFLHLYHGPVTASQDVNTTKVMIIGAIIDANSRIGREERVALEIAVADFSKTSSGNYKFVLHVSDSGGDPLKAASAADNLIKDKRVQVIIGMETWQEAALVAQVGNRAQVPVISFATAAITPPLTSVRWPFLARMANDASLQLRCAAKIVGSYRWRRVIVIYEDDTYGGDSGIVTVFSDALRDVGSEIEYSLALPPFSSLSDPKTAIRKELKKLQSKQSRVFIVHSSMQLATHMFTEAREMDLMGKESAWIATDSITSLLDNVNSSVMSSMGGVIGIKSYFSETSQSFQEFYLKFRKNYRSEYLDEDRYEPGIYAIRAYDTISIIARAAERLTNNGNTSETLLRNILSSNFSGLSGEIRFKYGELSQKPVYSIVNVKKRTYIELKLWSMELGFFEEKEGEEEDGEVLDGVVNWPGGSLVRAPGPRGWVMPSDSKPLVIGVPGRTSFEKFVKVREGEDPTGFCIDVFKEAVKLLDYDLPYVFDDPFYGNYDDLVDKVISQAYDAVVGDITILANRSKYLEFTQPYAESGLSMIVPVKSKDPQEALMFLKPFTAATWLTTGAIFAYTMFIVWFLEHRSNPQFRGPWKSQLGTSLWFTFCTLFFVQRERVRSNFTRIVMVVWLFVVFVLTSSYTASLTSMLTVPQLVPTVSDIDSLRKSNLRVGCDGDSFVRKYLVDVLDFDPNNIKNITSEYSYTEEFGSGNISAAFLELPYQKVFLSKYSQGYRDVGSTYRFGGLGFVFPKGSPIARDISKAILKLSEDGTISMLEKNWFRQSSNSSNSDTMNNQSLSLYSFWGLFVLTGATSTIVFLLYLLGLIKNFRRHQQAYQGATSPNNNSLWNRIKRLKDYFDRGSIIPASAQAVDVEEWSSINGEFVSMYNTPGHPQASSSSPAEIELPADTYIVPLDTHARVLNLASFPGWDGRCHGFDDPEQQRLPSST